MRSIKYNVVISNSRILGVQYLLFFVSSTYRILEKELTWTTFLTEAIVWAESVVNDEHSVADIQSWFRSESYHCHDVFIERLIQILFNK